MSGQPRRQGEATTPGTGDGVGAPGVVRSTAGRAEEPRNDLASHRDLGSGPGPAVAKTREYRGGSARTPRRRRMPRSARSEHGAAASPPPPLMLPRSPAEPGTRPVSMRRAGVPQRPSGMGGQGFWLDSARGDVVGKLSESAVGIARPGAEQFESMLEFDFEPSGDQTLGLFDHHAAVQRRL
jgi:hypothetical protein